MREPDARRLTAGPLMLLAALAAAGIVASLVVEPGTRTQAVTAAVTSGVAALAGAWILRAHGRPGGWPGAEALATGVALVGLAAIAFAVAGLVDEMTYRPRVVDAAFLILLVPFTVAMRQEFRTHLDASDRREIAIDVWLLAGSVAALFYLVIRPDDATTAASLSAATFAILAASQLIAFAALALWVPTASHLGMFVGFALYAIATVRFGNDWSKDVYAGGETWVNVAYVLAPLILGAVAIAVPHGSAYRPPHRARVARPVLTSAAVVAACGTLALVAIVDDARGLGGFQSSFIIGALGLSVAARILANQISSTQAHEEVREALERREQALRETDAALDRVREANETLRASEEHLRLVFDAAVDGFVELDDRGVVIRANDAFARMIGLDPQAIEGQPWTVLAAAVEGADPSFASLPEVGTTQIQRNEGQPLYLESRVSTVPTTPPRLLLLVRDVTAAKVADQTIRSLFQFLQDRDEDRTRLLRRTNAAIEAERNRIARDLHDGPVQGVSAASLSLEAALLMIKAGDVERGLDVLTKIRSELAGEADALRRLMSGLRPPVLEERGLFPALRDTLARFGTDQGVSASISGSVDGAVPDDLETLAFRIVQEALTNAAKHAQASAVNVHVETEGNFLRVEIDDDGTGFDSAKGREFLRQGRVGLASMRERVELASGTLTVRSSPGRGTTITAVLPLDSSPAAIRVP
ncbi:MAG TPA: ATP-binding protein [Actinomycetota bacterium]|nr:ATP-binding protein [Actinomycetota bacterium]